MEKQYKVTLAVLSEYEEFVEFQTSESELATIRKMCDAVEEQTKHTAVRLHSTQEI